MGLCQPQRMPDPYPSTSGRQVRVFQVATGNVGAEMIGRIQAHPDLELVGLHCYSPEKIGRDAGELAGLDPVGVTATGSVEEILAARPDVLTFHGVWPDVELYEQVLEAGIDIVTTADFITGHHRDANHRLPDGRTESEVIAAACERGASSFYGTGMNPGLAQILSIVHSTDVADIEKVTCIESVDVSCHHSVDTWVNCGFGFPADDPEQVRKLELGCRVFGDGVHLMADALGIELDTVDFECELGACTEDVDLGWYQLPKGSVGGAKFAYVGKADDAEDRAALGRPGVLRHPHRRRPGHLLQAHDHPEAGHAVRRRGLRVDRDDRDRDAGTERPPCRGRGAARDHHQRRPAAAGVRRSVQGLSRCTSTC